MEPNKAMKLITVGWGLFELPPGFVKKKFILFHKYREDQKGERTVNKWEIEFGEIRNSNNLVHIVQALQPLLFVEMTSKVPHLKDHGLVLLWHYQGALQILPMVRNLVTKLPKRQEN